MASQWTVAMYAEIRKPKSNGLKQQRKFDSSFKTLDVNSSKSSSNFHSPAVPSGHYVPVIAPKKSVRHHQERRFCCSCPKRGSRSPGVCPSLVSWVTGPPLKQWLWPEDWKKLVGLSQPGTIHGARDGVSFLLRYKVNAWRWMSQKIKLT